MYLWWCGNVIQSFVWRYIYCALLGSSLGISDSAMCNPGWGNWEIWFHLTGMICPWAGNLTANFWKMSNPHPMPFLPPPPRRLYIDRCIVLYIKATPVFGVNCTLTWFILRMILTIALAITRALETSKQVFLTGSCCVLLKLCLLLSPDKDKNCPRVQEAFFSRCMFILTSDYV